MRPSGVAYDSAGDLFIADSGRNQVFEITIGGSVTVVAGNGTQGFWGDNGPASAAELNSPSAVAVAEDGTLYIADTGNQRIRVVQVGRIHTFAGSGIRGYSGDGGPATFASLNHPVALALDSAGALLVCDQGNQRVRRISDGQIATIAGSGTQGFSGDGGAATAAELNEPSGLAANPDGRIFVADTANQRIRVISVAGVIATFAGTGVAGESGDSNQAANAQLSRPAGLALDAAGNLFIADENNHRLRRIAPDGTITSVAGSGVQGAAAESALALAAAQNLPTAAAVSSFGWTAIADPANRTVQILSPEGKLYTPAGLSARSTTLMQTTPNAVYGSAQTVITATGDSATPQGNISILDGARPIATASLVQGTATIGLPALNAGTRILTAVYTGDGLHPSTTATSSVTISPAPVTATAAAAQATYGTPLPALTGTITGVLPQDQSGVEAVFTANAPSTPAAGTYPIQAALTGPASANYAVSAAPNSGTLTIVPAAATATLVTPSNAYATLPLQLTAHVASTTSGTPTGTVEFLDGSSVIATAPLINGFASAVELNPSSGNHTLSVAYSGDANFRASRSGNLLEAVNALPDFTLAVTGNSQQTAIAGSSANFNLTIASQGGPFTGAVTLSATGLPTGAGVSFSPPAVVPGASAAAVTMTIVAPTTSADRVTERPELAFAAAAAAIWFLTLRRRKAVPCLLALVLLPAMLSLSGCGARVASESSVPVQTFPITIHATGTDLAGNVVVHTVSVTLAVE